MKISDEDTDLKTDVQKVLSQCVPCKFCNTNCMCIEEEEDWDGKGTVIRIESGCDKAYDLWWKEFWDKDEFRTVGFKLEVEAIKDWNELNKDKNDINGNPIPL
jgi:hypothetical protein